MDLISFAIQNPDLTARLMTVSLPLVGDSGLIQRVTSTSPSAWPTVKSGNNMASSR